MTLRTARNISLHLHVSLNWPPNLKFYYFLCRFIKRDRLELYSVEIYIRHFYVPLRMKPKKLVKLFRAFREFLILKSIQISF